MKAQTTQMTDHFSQINQPEQDLYKIAKSNPEKALASTWMQIKQNVSVLNKKHLSPLEVASF